MITYNHENFIAEAIHSVLNQQTKFPFELIIANDHSTDGTDKIIKENIINNSKYINIRYFGHENNIGMKDNFLFACEHCKGYYIALCEGDDYWTDPCKLQKQVDFLEANKDHSLCFHQTMTLYENGEEKMYNDFVNNQSFDFTDLIQRPFISTVSSMFKNPNPLPEWFKNIGTDWPLFLNVASKGRIYYMSDCMAVYRRHSGGIFSSLSNDEKYNKTITLLDNLDKIFNYEYHEYFEKSKQARHAIHYPLVVAPGKRSILSRIKNKIKTTLLSR